MSPWPGGVKGATEIEIDIIFLTRHDMSDL